MMYFIPVIYDLVEVVIYGLLEEEVVRDVHQEEVDRGALLEVVALGDLDIPVGLQLGRSLLDQPLRGAFPSLHEQAAQRVVQHRPTPWPQQPHRP